MWPPGAPFARVVPPQGTTLDDYQIPGGVLVVRAPWSVCRDPVLYPNPDTFRPERCLSYGLC